MNTNRNNTVNRERGLTPVVGKSLVTNYQFNQYSYQNYNTQKRKVNYPYAKDNMKDLIVENTRTQDTVNN